MISNQILQNTIDGLKGITRTDLCVIDVEGKILAATFPNAEAFIEPAQAFVASPADSQVINGCQFFKVFDDHQLEYVLLAYGDSEDVYMIGKIASFQIQNLLVAYKERFDKDNFIKNLLLDNLLLVDIYNRAKKLHIDIEVRRVVFIVETNREKDGNELEWLGETSSDEMVGHFYAYSNYFDLVADDEEKKLIASVVKKILDHILDNKFRLVDTDGVPTTWANWDPDLLNNDHKWIYEKGTNSLQILTFLKAGYHMTGEQRYEDAFEYLIKDKHFAMNLMQYKILDGHLLHIDDNHDFLMISLLMRYVEDPKLRSVFAMGLTHHWDDEKAERNAFFNFVYGACTGEQCDIEASVDELADYPMDQVLWTLYNSWRDLDWDMRPTEVGMIPQLCSPLPAHERRIIGCDSNRFIADSGIAGEAERLFTKSDDPTAFTMFPGTGDDHGMYLSACTNYTHPYWFARYHGLIEEAE